jgi:hypothetical protein
MIEIARKAPTQYLGVTGVVFTDDCGDRLQFDETWGGEWSRGGVRLQARVSMRDSHELSQEFVRLGKDEARQLGAALLEWGMDRPLPGSVLRLVENT